MDRMMTRFARTVGVGVSVGAGVSVAVAVNVTVAVRVGGSVGVDVSVAVGAPSGSPPRFDSWQATRRNDETMAKSKLRVLMENIIVDSFYE
jgi:hypothetical protein